MGIEVSLALDSSIPNVLADCEQIKRVIVNLIDNAAEAMTESPLRTYSSHCADLHRYRRTFGHRYRLRRVACRQRESSSCLIFPPRSAARAWVWLLSATSLPSIRAAFAWKKISRGEPASSLN